MGDANETANRLPHWFLHFGLWCRDMRSRTGHVYRKGNWTMKNDGDFLLIVAASLVVAALVGIVGFLFQL